MNYWIYNFMYKFFVLFILLMINGLMTVSYASTDLPDTLVIGKISHNPKKHYNYLKPVADYVVANLDHALIKKSKVRLAKNRQQMINWLRSGYVDWVTETPFVSAILMDKSPLYPHLIKWKKGVRHYKSIFFVKKNSKIKQLNDLKGKILALEDATSTSAFFVPALMLHQLGLPLIYLENVNQPVPSDKIGFVFVNEEISISTLVHRGIAAAGAFSDSDWDKEDHLPKVYRDELRIIKTSNNYLRAIESFRSGLSDTLVNNIKTILINANKTEAGKAALVAYQRTSAFEQLTLEEIKSIHGLVPDAYVIYGWAGL